MNNPPVRPGGLAFGGLFGAGVGCGAATVYALFLTGLFVALVILVLLATLAGWSATSPLADLPRQIAGLAYSGIVFILLALIVAGLVALLVGLVPAAFLGGITGLLVAAWLRRVGWRHDRRRAMLAGLLISLAVSLLVGLAAGSALLLAPGGGSDLTFPWFLGAAWLGPPVLIYLASGGYLGWYLHRRLESGAAAGSARPRSAGGVE